MRILLSLSLCLGILTNQTALGNPALQKQDMDIDVLLTIISTNKITDLDDLPAVLPGSFRANFTLKHGLINGLVQDDPEDPDTIRTVRMDGTRGHLLEEDLPGFGQHATPLAPRIFLFDQNTGFGISYNGGYNEDGSLQQGWNNLDTISFDFDKKTFALEKIDFYPDEKRIEKNSINCQLCHGPNNRPIFSMYPDWPRFFGSDNDELLFGEAPVPEGQKLDKLSQMRQDIQSIEWDWFKKLTSEIKKGNSETKYPNNKRLAPLFDAEMVKAHHKYDIYDQYPYRSDVEVFGTKLDASDVSRAFSTRAGLRFNLLYSRLLVQQVTNHVVNHENFDEFGEFFVHNIMRCGPERNASNKAKQSAVLAKWNDQLVTALGSGEELRHIEHKTWDPARGEQHHSYFKLPDGKLKTRADGSLLDYGQNLALMGLKINDVDMRFTYFHKAYLPENAFKNLCPDKMEIKDFPAKCADQVMQVGYLGDVYFNSYNDGSTTMDEHMTASLLTHLAKKDVALAEILRKRGPFAVRGLLNKYGSDTFKARMEFDRPFFTRMDEISKWFSLPYPYVNGDQNKSTSFMELHHRATFTPNYKTSYDQICEHLESKLL